jgi:hypothetical protein
MVLHHYSVAITVRQYMGVVTYLTQIPQFTIDTTEFPIQLNKAVAVRGGQSMRDVFHKWTRVSRTWNEAI